MANGWTLKSLSPCCKTSTDARPERAPTLSSDVRSRSRAYAARTLSAPIIVAKLDRLSRDVHFIFWADG